MFSRNRYAQPILLVLCALAGVLFALGVTGGAGASLVWNGDFETGNFSQYGGSDCIKSWSCTVVTAPGGHTGDAGRFEVRSGDTSPYGGERSEVQVNSNETIGSKSWWHFEVYLPSDFTDSSSFFQNLIDWHHYALGGGGCNCSTGTVPLSIQEISGRYVLRITKYNDPAKAIYWDQYDLGPATRGAWTSFDFYAKWSDDPTVAVEDVYVNGTQVQHITGHPNEFTGYFNYLKLGYYRAAEPITQVVYFDNVRRATSLADAEGSSWASNAASTTSTSTTTASTTTTAPMSWTTTTTPTTSITTTTPTTSTTTTAAPVTSTSQTSTSAAPPPAYKVSITSPAAGANLTGRVTWTGTTSGATTSEVDFFIDGNQKWTEYWAPYYFGGDYQYWDTAGVKNGNHTLMVRAISSTGVVTTSSINVSVNNPRKSLNKAS